MFDGAAGLLSLRVRRTTSSTRARPMAITMAPCTSICIEAAKSPVTDDFCVAFALVLDFKSAKLLASDRAFRSSTLRTLFMIDCEARKFPPILVFLQLISMNCTALVSLMAESVELMVCSFIMRFVIFIIWS